MNKAFPTNEFNLSGTRRDWSNNSRSRHLIRIMVLFSILLCFSCAGTKHATFQNKIQSMSDDDLVSYYRGITDRLRAVESDNVRERYEPDYNPESLAHPQSNIYFGTQEYGLVKKQKMILDELKRRGIKP